MAAWQLAIAFFDAAQIQKHGTPVAVRLSQIGVQPQGIFATGQGSGILTTQHQHCAQQAVRFGIVRPIAKCGAALASASSSRP